MRIGGVGKAVEDERRQLSMPRHSHSRRPETQPPESKADTDRPAEPQIRHRSFVQVLWQHKWVVALTVVLCASGALTYLYKATPVYTASSRLFVERSGPEIIKANEGFMTQSKNYLYTQAELLKSTPILTGAAKALAGRGLRTFAAAGNRVAFLKSSVDVSVGKKDDIITIALDSPSPTEAAEIVNAIVESYVAYHSRQRRDTAAEVLKILQREKIKRDGELGERFKALMDFKRANETISFGTDNSNIIIQRLMRLSDALTQAELELTDASAQYETTKVILSDPAKVQHLAQAQHILGSQGSAYREVDAFRDGIDELQVALVSLRQQYTADHPAVREAQAKLKLLSEQRDTRLSLLAEACLGAVRQQYNSAKNRVAELRTSLEAQRVLAQKLNSKAVEHAMLEADIKRTERMCDVLESRIKEIDVTEDAGALNISILEAAQPPEAPSKPNRTQVMAMALAAGLLLGIGLALVGDWMDHKFRSVEEISQALGLPALGVVPHVQSRKGSAVVGKVVDAEPLSQAAESYRTIRTAVYFGVPDNDAKTLLVTSPGVGDGKTTLASNLAISMAQAGQKVLVLDADFRRPSQHRVFQIDSDAVGLSDVLAGRGPLYQAIHRSGIENLDVLPCGTIPPNPSEMLSSRAFAGLLEGLSGRYDRIVLDAPPVIPVSDARILGATCDVALLVLRAEKSSRKPSQQAVETLLRVGSQILGVVVNDAPTRKNRYGYYHYGYYHGRYCSHGRGDRKDRGEEREEVAAVQSDAA